MLLNYFNQKVLINNQKQNVKNMPNKFKIKIINNIKNLMIVLLYNNYKKKYLIFNLNKINN